MLAGMVRCDENPQAAPSASCEAPDDALAQLLRARFGHPAFRPRQREVVEAVLAGRDCLAVLPTGGGKSVTYQLPAVSSGRTALVVSPLIALMRDQVDQARGRGLRAVAVDSTLAAADRAAVLRDVREGRVEVLYASPEGLGRLLSELAGCAAVGLFAVDEAHCISQWGHDFRPDYRMLGAARDCLPRGVPALAVTATATERVAADIVASLRLRAPVGVRGSFFRPNLRLTARRKEPARDARHDVLALLRAHDGEAAIVYRLSRAGAASFAGWLRRRGVAARAYHAGLDPAERAAVQDAFLCGEVSVIVATVAFGMGVDKPDVRLVVHADLPGSVEAYAQEVGRAGRDGEPSDCLLLYAWSDVRRHDALAGGLEPARRAAVRVAVREMYRLAASGRCRHFALCAHFGERIARPCEACDACGALSSSRLVAGGGW
jgi:ATP-dependent DNA helicase RecQ